jgi:hypothetical protein
MIQNLIGLIFNFTIKNTAVHVKCNSASGHGRQHNNYIANLILFIAPEKTEIQANSCEMDESLTLHRMSQRLLNWTQEWPRPER